MSCKKNSAAKSFFIFFMKKLLSLIKRAITHELIKGSSIVFLGSMVSNVLAFIFNLFLTRSLTYSEYGEFASLIALFTLATIPAQSFIPVVIQFSSQYLSKNENAHAAALYVKLTKFFVAGACSILGVFIILTVPIENFLHIQHTFFIFIIGLMVSIVYLGIVNGGYLQSMLQFGFTSITVIIGGVLKLGLGVFFVLLGWKVGGVLWALILSFSIPFMLTFLPLRKFFHNKQQPTVIHWKEIGAYAVPAAVTVFSLSAFTSTDLLLVKHFFTAHNAGLYAGLSLVGRVIFYFTAPISSVMFPLIIKRFSAKESFQNLFYFSLFLVLLPSAVLTIFYFALPGLVIKILLGGRGYEAVSGYIGWYGVYLTIFSMINVLVNFFLSLRRTEIAWIIAVGAICQAVLIFFFHQNFITVISISVFVTLVLLVTLLLYYTKEYANTKIIKKTLSFNHNPRL